MTSAVLARRVALMAGWGGIVMILLQEMVQQTNRDFVMANAQPFTFFIAMAFSGTALAYLSTWNGKRADAFEKISASMIAFSVAGLLIAVLLGGALYEMQST